ncbi:MAG: DUF1826 domain-containing protein [Pseudomonadota bacterium]
MLRPKLTDAEALSALQSYDQGDIAAHPWEGLRLDDPATSLAIVPLPANIPARDIDLVLHSPAQRGRWVNDCAGLIDDCSAVFPEDFARALAHMIKDYDAFMRPELMCLRVEAVRGKACWKWHCDFTSLRLICTLRGPGTQYLPDAADEQHFCSIPAAHFGLFKGRDYSPGHIAVKHRSPPPGHDWNGDAWDVRLVVVLDALNTQDIAAMT